MVKLNSWFKKKAWKLVSKIVLPKIAKVLSSYNVRLVFNGNPGAVGHIAHNTYKYLLLCKYGVYNEKPIFITFNGVLGGNEYYHKLVLAGCVRFSLNGPHFCETMRQAIRYGLFRDVYEDEVLYAERLTTSQHNDIFRENFDNNPVKSFLPFDDVTENDLLLKEMGISTDDWYICFMSRDSAYYKNVKCINMDENNALHDTRNSDINNCLKAAEYITNLGGFALRMGQEVEKKLSTNNSKIVDYSNKFRTDKADVLVTAKSKFVLSSSCGYSDLSYMGLGIPTAIHNFFHVTRYWHLFDLSALSNDQEVEYFCSKMLLYPKQYYSIDKKRLLTISEIFQLSTKDLFYGNDFENLNIELIENSEDEILDLAKEMNSRIDGNYTSSTEEGLLRKRIYEISKKYHGDDSKMLPYAGCYLLKYKDLIK